MDFKILDAFDDELYHYLKYYFNRDYEKEHDKPLRIEKGKIFILGFDKGEFVGFCSRKGNIFGDVHIPEKHRGKKYASEFVRRLTKKGDRAVSRKPQMIHLFYKAGFTMTGRRGRAINFEWR